MGRASREKGKRGEREAATALNEALGLKMRRGVQYEGLTGAADIVGLPRVHFEVKRVKRLALNDAMLQAELDAKDGETPVVLHRVDGGRWRVTVDLDNLADFLVSVYLESYKVQEIMSQREVCDHVRQFGCPPDPKVRDRH